MDRTGVGFESLGLKESDYNEHLNADPAKIINYHKFILTKDAIFH